MDLFVIVQGCCGNTLNMDKMLFVFTQLGVSETKSIFSKPLIELDNIDLIWRCITGCRKAEEKSFFLVKFILPCLPANHWMSFLYQDKCFLMNALEK